MCHAQINLSLATQNRGNHHRSPYRQPQLTEGVLIDLPFLGYCCGPLHPPHPPSRMGPSSITLDGFTLNKKTVFMMCSCIRPVLTFVVELTISHRAVMTVWNRGTAKMSRPLRNALPGVSATHNPTCHLPYDVVEMITAVRHRINHSFIYAFSP